MSTMTLGWHFCAIRDGNPVLRDGAPLVIGQLYEHIGDLRLCETGYHDSLRVIDTLKYAPGAYLCRTLASGDLTDTDKRVSHYRIALAGMDATSILRDLAGRIAFCALLAERERGREPHRASWEAVRVSQRYARGEATAEELNEAWSAAWGAAEGAAWSAAESATESAAWSAARSAAWSAARNAAWSAAWSAAEGAAESAAWSAARSAAWSAAESATESAAWSAARSAAWSAAWSAAESATNDLLLSMIPVSLVTPEGE